MAQLENNLSVNDSFTKKEKKNRKRNRLTMDAVKNDGVIENVDMNETRAEKEPGKIQNGNTTTSPAKKPKRNALKNNSFSEDVGMNGSLVEKEPDNIQTGSVNLSSAKKIKKDALKSNKVTSENVETPITPTKKSKKDKKLEKSLILNKSVEGDEYEVGTEDEKKRDKSLILNKSVEENEVEDDSTTANDFIALENTQPEENKDPMDSTNATENGINKSLEAPKYTPEDLARTVYVTNVPSVAKFFELSRLFMWAGKVVRISFLKGIKGNSRAFVKLEDETTAKKALELDGIFFYGKNLQITKIQKTVFGDSNSTVYVGNLPYSVTEEKLRQVFEDCGEIEYVKRMPLNTTTCRSFVCFKSPEAASLALELNNAQVNGRHIFVQRYDPHRKEILIKKTEGEKQKNTFRRFEKNTKARNNKASQFKPKFETKPKKSSEFRGVKTTLKKVPKVKKPKLEKMEWVIEQVAPEALISNE